jgi:hypothetical protein
MPALERTGGAGGIGMFALDRTGGGGGTAMFALERTGGAGGGSVIRGDDGGSGRFGLDDGRAIAGLDGIGGIDIAREGCAVDTRTAGDCCVPLGVRRGSGATSFTECICDVIRARFSTSFDGTLNIRSSFGSMRGVAVFAMEMSSLTAVDSVFAIITPRHRGGESVSQGVRVKEKPSCKNPVHRS